MAFAREIIKKVLENVRFRVPTTEEKNSYYTQIGNTLVRISNHCTRLYVWDDMLEKNPKWKGLPIVSIVFEDTEDTFNETECLMLKRFRMKPIKVKEYVYRLQGNPQFLTPKDEKLIIQSMKKISNGQYTDMTNKCSGPELRVSVNPQDNNQLNCNLNMNKKLIRLTESDIHRIVKESVNRVLKEENDGSYTIQQHELEGSLKNLEYSRNMAKKAYEAIKNGNIEEASRMIITVYNDLHGEITHMMDVVKGSNPMQPSGQL